MVVMEIVYFCLVFFIYLSICFCIICKMTGSYFCLLAALTLLFEFVWFNVYECLYCNIQASAVK
jgi:hypothetical protein